MVEQQTALRPFDSSDQGRSPYSAEMVLEKCVLLHAAALIVVTSWLFGGQSPAGLVWLHVWGSLGIGLFITSLWLLHFSQPRLPLRVLGHLWPLLCLDILVLLGCLNPTLATIVRLGDIFLKLVEPPYAWLPSSARPDLALRHLVTLNGIIISAYNIHLVLRYKRQIRQLMVLIAGNAAVLAVFGTFQSLVRAKGLWFGLVTSPQVHFFSTFVYHNHWGAFTLLNASTCLGLLFRAWLKGGHRDFMHSPVFTGAVVTMLLAASIPLSASRSCTFLMIILLLGALANAISRIIRRRRERSKSALLPIAAVVVFSIVSVVAIVNLGSEIIGHRVDLTAEQLSQGKQGGYISSRLQLYRDTWDMALRRPWFGWGLESYGDVFRIYNTQRVHYDTATIIQPYYRYAHSDWLQSLAELGFVGTFLLIALGAMPFWGLGKRAFHLPIPRYLLGGCLLVALYAWVEFPFANPSVLIAFWISLFAAARYALLDKEAQGNDYTQ